MAGVAFSTQAASPSRRTRITSPSSRSSEQRDDDSAGARERHEGTGLVLLGPGGGAELAQRHQVQRDRQRHGHGRNEREWEQGQRFGGRRDLDEPEQQESDAEGDDEIDEAKDMEPQRLARAGAASQPPGNDF
jgi:hypothetical protein